jgi:hypothetical protein
VIGWNGVKGAKSVVIFQRSSSGTMDQNALERQVHDNWVSSVLEEYKTRDEELFTPQR